MPHWSVTIYNWDFYSFYASNLRTPLFTGFFTLSSFLFAVKTFIILNMKKEVYDSEPYRERLANQRTQNKQLSHYGPLMRLSTLLFWTVVAAFSTSVMQLTIGLIPSKFTAAACLFMAFCTILLVLVSLVIVRMNIKEWLNLYEQKSSSPK